MLGPAVYVGESVRYTSTCISPDNVDGYCFTSDLHGKRLLGYLLRRRSPCRLYRHRNAVL